MDSSNCRKAMRGCVYLSDFRSCEHCHGIGHECDCIHPQTESDDDTLKPPSELSSPELLNIVPKMKSRAASDNPDRVEDPAAVLCNRSGTGRVSQLSRVSLLLDYVEHSPTTVDGPLKCRDGETGWLVDSHDAADANTRWAIIGD